ncbi:MAG: hypothetical protein ACUVUD_07220 [bacterium]
MAEAPIIKRGNRYFCPGCGHLMERLHRSCPVCQLVFKGEVKDEVRPKQEPLKIPEIEEKYEKIHTQKYLLTGIISIIAIAILAIILLLVLRR